MDIEDLNRIVREKFKEFENSDDLISDSYSTFVNEEEGEYELRDFFEKLCDFSISLMPFFKGIKNKDMSEALEIANIKATPGSVTASAVLTFLLGLLSMLPFLVIHNINFAFFAIGTFTFIAVIIYTYPRYKSEITKIQAQQDSLLAVLYMTIYMRVNPILENAILFASQHISGPLEKDLKRIMWLVNMQKVESINDAVKIFTPLWIKRNPSFVKAFLTMEEVLNQADAENQSKLLDKALNELLNETFTNMKHYAHDLKMPVMLVNMFGLLLPLIGLITFPLIGIFMAGSISMSSLFFGYIVLLPALVYFVSERIISKRPGAFSAPSIKNIPHLPKKNHYLLKLKDGREVNIPLVPIALGVAFLIMLPGFVHLFTVTLPLYFQGLRMSAVHGSIEIPQNLGVEYWTSSIILVNLIPLGLAVGLFILLYGRSIQKKKIRDYIVSLEDDLNSSLFQIANQFTENIPLEIGIEKFLQNYEMLNLKKKEIYDFFSRILRKMNKLGLTFEQAVFDKEQGVLPKFPSPLLKEVIWIMIETAKKGNRIMYAILVKVSGYLDNLKKVKELIYDLLNDTVTSIKFQAKFMSPFISAVVASLSLVIVKSLYQVFRYIQTMMNSITSGMSGMSVNDYFTNMINFTKIVPPPLFQVLIGVYLIESVALLMILANGIENGFDEIERDILTAKGVLTATILYIAVDLLVMVIFNHTMLPQIINAGGV